MSSCVFTPISGSWASGPEVRLEEGAQKRLCSSNEGALWEENMFHSQDDENNFHFYVSKHRLSSLMVALLGKEEAKLGLMNAMVWGKRWWWVFNELKTCRCALGGMVRKEFPPYAWKPDGCSVRSASHRLGIKPWLSISSRFPVVATT